MIWYSSCSLSSSSPSFHYQEHLSKTGQFLEGGSGVFIIIIIFIIIAMHCLQVWKEGSSYSGAEAHLLRGRVLRGGGTAQWVHQNKVRFFFVSVSIFYTSNVEVCLWRWPPQVDTYWSKVSMDGFYTKSISMQQSKDSYPLHSVLAVIHAITKEMLCPRHVSAEFDKSSLLSKYERQKLEECVLLLLLVAKEMLRIATQAGGRFCKVLAWRNNLLVKEERFERILLVT